LSATQPEPAATHRLRVRDAAEHLQLFGPGDAYLRRLEEAFGVTITAAPIRSPEGTADPGATVTISGPPAAVAGASAVLEQVKSAYAGGTPSPQDLEGLILGARSSAPLGAFATTSAGPAPRERDPGPSPVIVTTLRGRRVVPQTPAQRRYVEAIRDQPLVFGIGPAGTGKTYLAMAMAVAALRDEQVTRLVLTRPAVEAGERLGFLPGDLQEKVDPYLRPIYDALYEMLPTDRVQRMLERATIEVAPLAFMRGRTLNDAFVVCDEAQNTTPEQLKMLLTRIGFGSKMVVTGDITQVDLPSGHSSGLNVVRGFLDKVPGVEFVYFTQADVVRHQLVQDIVRAYEAFEAESEGGRR
jgi:phosphate starvation-inducible PhoH-like protein